MTTMKTSNPSKNNKSINHQETLSHKEIAKIVAAAWNNQDASLLEPYLYEDFEYSSMALLNIMKGKDNYLAYLSGKFDAFKNGGITYHAEVVEENGISSVVCKSNMEEIPVAVLDFEVSNGLIKKMLIRPEHIYNLSDFNNSEQYVIIERNIVDKICSYINESAKSLGFESSDLDWLQYTIYDAPAFQHLCFRLGKAVFSLMIYIYEITPGFDGENLSTVLLPNVKKDNQLRECELYNLIPCSVYIDVNALRDPTIVDTRTHEPINLKEIATTADSTMSKWEIWNWGVQIVASYLNSQNIDSLSYTNVLEFCPQIHYEKDGMKHFVYIYAHPSGVDEIPPINKSLIEQLVDWKGYYVNISLSNMFGTDGWTFRTEILYRTAGLLHNRVELMPIEEAIERYGTIETETAAVNYLLECPV